MWAPEERGKAIAIFSLAPLLGPVVGPVCGGWLVMKVTQEASTEFLIFPVGSLNAQRGDGCSGQPLSRMWEYNC